MTNKATAHTQYSKHAKLRKLAIEKITNNHRFLFKDSPDKEELAQKIKQNITPYLIEVVLADSPLQTQIDALEKNPNQNAALQKKIRDKQKLLTDYSIAYHQAIIDYRQTTADMQALSRANRTFLALEEKQDEYLYIIDKDTCEHLCREQGSAEDAPQKFENKQNIELAGSMTDAVRVWHNNITLNNLTIRDNRNDIETGHRDGIQLIPPPAYKEKDDGKGGKKLVKLADQMVGTILENATITNCHITAPNAALQGIFSSDGMCRNLDISHVEIKTKGKHFISIAGALTGCKFNNITLHQLNEKYEAEIGLYPLRIGGNMADDGMISIIDFHPSSTVKYGAVTQTHNNVYKLGKKTSEPFQITDKRDKIPPEFIQIAFALEQFDYDTYYAQYTTWTLTDFKRELAELFRKMEAWIDLRVTEYGSQIRRPENKGVLPDVSKEQHNPKKFGVIWALKEAQKALVKFNSGDAEYTTTHIPELQETAIRSFAMKCIAIKNGQVVKLYDLGEQENEYKFTRNEVRKAYLQHLLADHYFAADQLERKNNPYYIPEKAK